MIDVVAHLLAQMNGPMDETVSRTTLNACWFTLGAMVILAVLFWIIGNLKK